MSGEVRIVNVSDFRPHPKNDDIYTNDDISDVLEKIDKYGFQDEYRLLVTPNNRILSGHRRWKAAKQLGIEEVPAEVKPTEDEDEELLTILLSNRYRDKTPAETVNEAEAWAELEAPEKGQGTRTDLTCGNSTTGSTPDDRKTREKAAKHVGMSGRTFERGKRVKDAAESPTKAKDAGMDHETAKREWEKMGRGEQSIHGAYDEAKEDNDPDDLNETYGPEEYECTVCGGVWYGWDFLEHLEKKTVPVDQICIVNWPDEFVIHFPPEVVNEYVA